VSFEGRLDDLGEPAQVRYPVGEITTSLVGFIDKIRTYLDHNPPKRTVSVNHSSDGGFFIQDITIQNTLSHDEIFSYGTAVKPIDIVRRAYNNINITGYNQDEDLYYREMVSLTLTKDINNGLCAFCLSNKFLKKINDVNAKKNSDMVGPNGNPVVHAVYVTICLCQTCNKMQLATAGYGRKTWNYITKECTDSKPIHDHKKQAGKTFLGHSKVTFHLEEDLDIFTDENGVILSE